MRLVYVEEEGQWLPRATQQDSTLSAEDEYLGSLDSFGWGEALEGLTEKQRFVLELRWGLRDAGRSYTLREIATVMGVSYQTVGRHEKAAIRRLRGRHLG